MRITNINARDLPDLWFQAIGKVLQVGRRFVIDKGSYAGQTRLEFDYFVGRVKMPCWGIENVSNLLPTIPKGMTLDPPCDVAYILDREKYERPYVDYLMTAEMNKDEAYTYGSRMVRAFASQLVCERYKAQDKEIVDLRDIDGQKLMLDAEAQLYVNQIEWIIETYKTMGHRNNQMVLQIAEGGDCLLLDPPCLRQIDTRIQTDEQKDIELLLGFIDRYYRELVDKSTEDSPIYGTFRQLEDFALENCPKAIEEFNITERPEYLNFIIYFRSWDLWGGLPANLAGIAHIMQYMADSIGVLPGQMICESKGLHLYGYAEQLAEMRTLKQ